jgi:hypothetical protein
MTTSTRTIPRRATRHAAGVTAAPRQTRPLFTRRSPPTADDYLADHRLPHLAGLPKWPHASLAVSFLALARARPRKLLHCRHAPQTCEPGSRRGGARCSGACSPRDSGGLYQDSRISGPDRCSCGRPTNRLEGSLMPSASVTRFRRVAGTGLDHVDPAFAQVRLVRSAGSGTHAASRYWPSEIAATACVVPVEAVVASASGGV